MLITFLMPLFRLSRGRKRLIQLAADAVLISFSFFVAMLLRLDSWAFVANPRVWMVLPVMIPVSLGIFVRLGFYRAVIRYMSMKAVKTVLLGVAGSAMSLMAINYLFSLPVPRSVPIIYAMLAMLTIGGVRFALRSVYLASQVRYKTRVLVYGAGESGRQLVVSLCHGREYEPIAFVDDYPALHGDMIQGLRVYPSREVARLIEDFGVDKILLAVPSASHARRREILQALEPLPVPVQSIPGMADVISGKASVNEIRDVAVEDLLGRDPIAPSETLMGANITGKVVMVTGAGGSIGSELCRQIIDQAPRTLLLLDVCEYSLYRIEQELKQALWLEAPVDVKALLCSVQHRGRLHALMTGFGVQTVYHAAAYKHVPMVEHNVVEGLRNNVMGTLSSAKAAIAAGVESFVLISTDKAVRPTNVMGASKRMAELVCQALGAHQSATRFSMVRFGNVLGSSGSVVPLFRRQIESGGPVTVTHPEITRYFMTITEAAQLVIQAGAMARGGDVFVLDMGEPVKIADLAVHMVRLSGLEPSLAEDDDTGDIDIVFTGLRPGEKLYEELLIGESVEPTQHPRIMTAHEAMLEWPVLCHLLDDLLDACQRLDYPAIRRLLIEAPTGYMPRGELVDFLQEARRQAHDLLGDERFDLGKEAPRGSETGKSEDASAPLPVSRFRVLPPRGVGESIS